jgi:succinate dehydrogenase / fumarate reductase, cytochrome b subunit
LNGGKISAAWLNIQKNINQINRNFMSNLLTTSIGKKFIMSLTGIFLMLFILVHLSLNLLLIFDDSGALFNQGAHFMETYPVVKIVELVLGLGFLVHILWSLVISYRNWKARPVTYARKDRQPSSTWSSRNMLILGALILVFLGIHLANFFWVIKFDSHSLVEVPAGGDTVKDVYTLVSGLFKQSIPYSMLYIVGAILLGLHLTHGFWSAFQTLGLGSSKWMIRLRWVAWIYAFIVAVGFSSIPLYFIFKF